LYVDILREYGEHYLLADRVDTEGWWTLKERKEEEELQTFPGPG